MLPQKSIKLAPNIDKLPKSVWDQMVLWGPQMASIAQQSAQMGQLVPQMPSGHQVVAKWSPSSHQGVSK